MKKNDEMQHFLARIFHYDILDWQVNPSNKITSLDDENMNQ